MLDVFIKGMFNGTVERVMTKGVNALTDRIKWGSNYKYKAVYTSFIQNQLVNVQFENIFVKVDVWSPLNDRMLTKDIPHLPFVNKTELFRFCSVVDVILGDTEIQQHYIQQMEAYKAKLLAVPSILVADRSSVSEEQLTMAVDFIKTYTALAYEIIRALAGWCNDEKNVFRVCRNELTEDAMKNSLHKYFILKARVLCDSNFVLNTIHTFSNNLIHEYKLKKSFSVFAFEDIDQLDSITERALSKRKHLSDRIKQVRGKIETSQTPDNPDIKSLFESVFTLTFYGYTRMSEQEVADLYRSFVAALDNKQKDWDRQLNELLWLRYFDRASYDRFKQLTV